MIVSTNLNIMLEDVNLLQTRDAPARLRSFVLPRDDLLDSLNAECKGRT